MRHAVLALLAAVIFVGLVGARGRCRGGYCCQPCPCPCPCSVVVRVVEEEPVKVKIDVPVALDLPVVPVVPVLAVEPVPVLIFQYLPAVGVDYPSPRRGASDFTVPSGVSGEGLDLPPMAALTEAEGLPPSLETSEARPVFLSRCAVCHQQPFHQGGVTLLDAAGREVLARRGFALSREQVAASVESGRMPVGARLTATEVAAVRRWASGGPGIARGGSDHAEGFFGGGR